MLDGKNIMITGGSGSFGRKMVQIILSEFKPKQLIVFSRDELKQFEMAQRWSEQRYPIRYMLGDVRDREGLLRACRDVDYVIHAAALKQVPAAEHNPVEFIKTNVQGAMNVIEAATHQRVKKVIALSTDKACNPINLYGATKLCSDKLFVAANGDSELRDTSFSVVRYGNVLGSRGSVVPFFKEKAKTGVLPITDRRMTRFWITLDQAVRFVLMTLSEAVGGEIFVPKIPSMRITDLAEAIAPQCKQEIVGIRVGEKLHEMLIGIDEARNAIDLQDHYVIQVNPRLQDRILSRGDGKGKFCHEEFCYSSDTNTTWLSVDDLKKIIDQISDDYTGQATPFSSSVDPQHLKRCKKC